MRTGLSRLMMWVLVAGTFLLIPLVTRPAEAGVLVNSFDTNQVLEYNGTTGAFDKAFVTAGSGGLGFPFDLAFGPNGDLLAGSLATNEVLEYNGTTGAFDKAFVTAGSGGLSTPTFMTFSPSVSVPEPSALSLMGLAFLGLAYVRR